MRIKTLQTVSAVFALWWTLSGYPISAHDTKWQIVFEYTENDLTVLDAQRLPPTRKEVTRSADLVSPLVISCDLSWLDANGKPLHSCPVALQLGTRSLPSPDHPSVAVIPEKGTCLVVATGPPIGIEPHEILLARTGESWSEENLRSRGAPFSLGFVKKRLALGTGFPKVALGPGPIGITKVHSSGDDDNRIIVAILGDGYTEQNLALGKFAADVQKILSRLQTVSPWKEYLQAINVYRIDVVSNEEGIDQPATGIQVDSYFESYIDPNNLVIRPNDAKILFTIFQYLPPPAPESIILVCNTPVYSGGGDIDIASVYNGQGFENVPLLNQGYQFGHLASEFETGRTSYPELQEDRLNWDKTFERDRLKWKHWVEPDTPLPTPETIQYSSVVGAFEGANRWPTNVYRPYLDCKMRSITPPFCPVCRELLSIKIILPVDLADVVSPPAGTTQTIPWNGAVFSVYPLDVSPLTYEWKLGGNILSSEVGPNLAIHPEDITSETEELRLTIRHPTPFIRKREIFRIYSWILEKGTTSSISGWDRYK